MSKRLDRNLALRLSDSLNLPRSLISAANPRTVRLEHTGLCACCTYRHHGTPTYSNRIAAEIRTLYRAGLSSTVRYLCVSCCRDLSPVFPVLYQIAYDALLVYRIIERENRAEDKVLDAEEMILVRKEESKRAVVQPEIVTVQSIKSMVSLGRRTRGKGKKPKNRDYQPTIFNLGGL